MIFTCDTKAFRAALAVAGKVIPAKSPWPILTNLKLVTNDDRVTLIGSDGDTTFEMDVPAAVQTEGASAIPFAPLATFISAAKGDQISVTVEKGQATLKAGRSRIALSAPSVEDFPIYTPPDGSPVAVDPETFCAALRFCAAAAATDDTQWTMGGPNLCEHEGAVEVWGTDGKAMHQARLDGLPSIGGGATIPNAAVTTILGIMEKADQGKALVSGNGWHVEAGHIRAWGKVVDGKFPNVRRVIEGLGDMTKVIVPTQDDLSGAITVATCGADSDSTKSRNVILIADAGKPVIVRGQKGIAGVIHAGRAEIDRLSETDARGVLSSRLLVAALAGMRGGDVLIETGRLGDSAVFRLSPAQDSATLTMSALIMSQRFSEAEMADV
jgi:DNA polymerase-3 subunit beta